MPEADPETIIHRYYWAMFNDLDTALSLVGPDYFDHNQPDGPAGPASVCDHVRGILTTFPDFELHVEDVIWNHGKFVSRVTGHGTHSGRWMGIEPTGCTVRVKGINIDRIQNGLIVEHWGEADTIGMLMQMGVDPFSGRLR